MFRFTHLGTRRHPPQGNVKLISNTQYGLDMVQAEWLSLKPSQCSRGINRIRDFPSIQLVVDENINRFIDINVQLLCRNGFERCCPDHPSHLQLRRAVADREVYSTFHSSIEHINPVGGKEHDAAEILQVSQKYRYKCISFRGVADVIFSCFEENVSFIEQHNGL